MSLYANYKTDSAKETEGVTVELATNKDGTVASIVLSRMGQSNKAYTKALERETKPYRRQIDLGTLSEEVATKLFLKVFATTVVKGWSNVRDENDVEMAFNESNVIKLLTDLPELYAQLQEQSKSIALFRDTALEAEAKN